MILVDALYINDGGGKILLDYLIAEIEKKDLQVCYLIDDRINKDSYSIKPQNKIIFHKANFKLRYKFYKENENRFSHILCFGNLPPNILLTAKTYTYLHQQLFLSIPKNTPIFQQLLYQLKKIVLKKIKNNTDYWLVQTHRMRFELERKLNVNSKRILVMPFYPELTPELDENLTKEKHTFIYVGNAPVHKNHKRLINAFCRFYDLHKVGKLILTVDGNFKDIDHLIKEKQTQGYPIENMGFVSKETLKQLYAKSEYTIYPSLAESLGLGIIEAINFKCKVIGADLEYMKAVCKPSLTFNPFDENSIVKSLSRTLSYDIIESEVYTQNEIKKIIKLLY